MLQLNAVTRNDNDVGQLVREYLNREGPGLLRDLLHRSKICCCHRTTNGAVTEEIPTSSDEIMTSSDLPMTSQNIVTSLNSSLNQHQPVQRRRTLPDQGEEGEDFDRKRQRVVIGEQDTFLLACVESTHHVTPGQQMTATWNLQVRDVTSRWSVEEEGESSLVRVGEVQWSGGEDTIRTFSTVFLAPSVPGTHESRWSLVRDGRVVSNFVFCKAIVGQFGGGPEVNRVATHGNIPSDVSTPKLLNNNKVFCISKNSSDSPANNSSFVNPHNLPALINTSEQNIPQHSSANNQHSSANNSHSSANNQHSSANNSYSSTNNQHSSANISSNISFVNVEPTAVESDVADDNSNLYEAGYFLENADPPLHQMEEEGEIKMLNI
eukprot:sb/3465699/